MSSIPNRIGSIFVHRLSICTSAQFFRPIATLLSKKLLNKGGIVSPLSSLSCSFHLVFDEAKIASKTSIDKWLASCPSQTSHPYHQRRVISWRWHFADWTSAFCTSTRYGSRCGARQYLSTLDTAREEEEDPAATFKVINYARLVSRSRRHPNPKEKSTHLMSCFVSLSISLCLSIHSLHRKSIPFFLTPIRHALSCLRR